MDSDNETGELRNGDFFKKQKQKKETSKAKSAKEWTDEETSQLIDLLESNPCLWDVFDKSYSKRDVKESAYSEIAESLDTNIALVKAKINNLRTQFGKELSKERRTKSGQSTDELYSSKWAHFDKLAFLTPVIGASKSRDTLKRMNKEEQEEEDDDKEVTSNKTRKLTVAEKKLELLSRCTEAISAKKTPIESPKISAFAMYIDEKLSRLQNKQRRIAEKRINDILFEIEMEGDSPMDTSTQNQLSQFSQNFPNNFQGIPPMIQGHSFMDMLNKK